MRPKSPAEATTAPGRSPLSGTGRFTSPTTMVGIRARRVAHLGHVLMGVWAIAAGLLTASQVNVQQLLERQAQTFFFELRGPVAPPRNIVIVALDEESLAQGKVYQTAPDAYPDLAPLETVPPRRSAYAIAIERLFQAGAKGVAIDVVLDARGANPADDAQLQRVLQQHAGRVALATLYQETRSRLGSQIQLLLPNSAFQTRQSILGIIHYPIEPNGRIHQLGRQYLRQIAQTYEELGQVFPEQEIQILPFATATLQAAQLEVPPSRGQNLYYYGPAGTFTQISLWQVLDAAAWQTLVAQGVFQDAIVLIGATAPIYQDLHAAPFSETLFHPNPLSGVEIHANAVATLMERRTIAQALPHPWVAGGVVFGLVLFTGVIQSRKGRSLGRLGLALGLALSWGGISYLAFTYGYLILPAAIPMAAIALTGLTYVFTQSLSDYFRQVHLRQTLRQYASSPIVQEIISQQDDLHDLLEQREKAVLGTQLAGRYAVVKVLGVGGFSETFLAEDSHRPGNPRCVVKHLHPVSNNPKLLHLARHMFQREAEMLERLGKHAQIPQLLAYFEEDQEFYLVQEFIAGHPLNHELRIGMPLPEARVIGILRELLEILLFVHGQHVIHRDIKPNNIIRREADQRLVLIDFGAVKEIPQLTESQDSTNATVGIGTKGFMPSEQCAGNPRFSSDIYAVGITGIQALTGLPPSHLGLDPETGELRWRSRAPHASQSLVTVLTKMVRYDFTQRYQSAQEALDALDAIADIATTPVMAHRSNTGMLTEPLNEAAAEMAETRLWEDFDTLSDNTAIAPSEPTAAHPDPPPHDD